MLHSKCPTCYCNLGEGNAKTNEFYCGRCVPLLDSVNGREIMQPTCSINLNMFEYVSYIIRKVICEQLQEELL